MITIARISDVEYRRYDEVWAIVRSLKYGNPRIKHVPELSPSWSLFRKYREMVENGEWNDEAFRRIYVPRFLKEMHEDAPRALLNELIQTKKNICIVCFCTEEVLCHRSIIGGILQGAGIEVRGLSRDYSEYFRWYKDGVPGMRAEPVTKSDAQPKICDHNKNVTYLYDLDCMTKDLFGDSLPTMCFTGRRPKDLCGYDSFRYNAFAKGLSDLIYTEFYEKRGIRRFITGGAQGFDQLSFWAVHRMKKEHQLEDVESVVFVPYEHYETRWAAKGCFSKAEYWQMIEHADRVVVISESNETKALFDRNHAMCRCSSMCLGLYPDDGWTYGRGGTAECMTYAKGLGITMFRLGYSMDEGSLCMDSMLSV